jgi:hypothetical protein
MAKSHLPDPLDFTRFDGPLTYPDKGSGMEVDHGTQRTRRVLTAAFKVKAVRRMEEQRALSTTPL